MCSEWFELVEQAKLSNEQTEQLTIIAQAQFKVSSYVASPFAIFVVI